MKIGSLARQILLVVSEFKNMKDEFIDLKKNM